MESDDSIITPLRIIDAGARWLDSAEGEEEMQIEAEYIEGIGSVLLALGAKQTNAMKMGRLLGQAIGIQASLRRSPTVRSPSHSSEIWSEKWSNTSTILSN
jgi:hypothetical protein